MEDFLRIFVLFRIEDNIEENTEIPISYNIDALRKKISLFFISKHEALKR